MRTLGTGPIVVNAYGALPVDKVVDKAVEERRSPWMDPRER